MCLVQWPRGEREMWDGKGNGEMESSQKAWLGGQALPTSCPTETYLYSSENKQPQLCRPMKKAAV